MFERNKTLNKFQNKNKNFNYNCHSSRELKSKKIPSIKNNELISKVILKGKLFGLINKSNIMTEEQFNDIKLKINLSKLEKYKEPKRKVNEQFYYAQNNPNILISSKNSDKFEDDYINAKEFINKKFTPREQKTILSFPQFFQLSSNQFLKELLNEKHKNLYEILGNEERKEKEMEKIRQKKRNIMNTLKNNYSTHRNSIKLLKSINLNDKDKTNEIINKLNFKNKSKFKSRNHFNNNNLFKNNFYYTNRNNINNNRNLTNNNCFNTFQETDNNFIISLNKEDFETKKTFFNNDVRKNYSIMSKIMENKTIEKFENMRKRKEMIILNNKKKIDLMKEKNKSEQSKKELERIKIYEEKKYIESILKKLKKNYKQINKENEKINKNKNNISDDKDNDINDSEKKSSENIIDILKNDDNNDRNDNLSSLIL